VENSRAGAAWQAAGCALAVRIEVLADRRAGAVSAAADRGDARLAESVAHRVATNTADTETAGALVAGAASRARAADKTVPVTIARQRTAALGLRIVARRDGRAQARDATGEDARATLAFTVTRSVATDVVNTEVTVAVGAAHADVANLPTVDTTAGAIAAARAAATTAGVLAALHRPAGAVGHTGPGLEACFTSARARRVATDLVHAEAVDTFEANGTRIPERPGKAGGNAVACCGVHTFIRRILTGQDGQTSTRDDAGTVLGAAFAHPVTWPVAANPVDAKTGEAMRGFGARRTVE